MRRLHHRSRPQELNGLPFRRLPGPVMPFAFWQTVYLNPARHPAAELPVILAYEHAHVRLWHTLDILLAQLSLVFYWFNPGGWLLRRALHENLEFQADYRVLRTRPHEARAYQCALLHQSICCDPANEIVCHFSFHLLKTRIAMMNARPSSPRQLLRYAAGLTVLATLAVGCATPKVAELPVPLKTQQDASSYSMGKMTYFLNGLPSTKEEGFNAPDKGSDSGNGEVNRMHVFKGTKPGQNVDMAVS